MKRYLITLFGMMVIAVLAASPALASDTSLEDEVSSDVTDPTSLAEEALEATNDHPASGNSSCWCSAIKGTSCRIDSCQAPKVARCKGYGGAWPEKFPHWCSCSCK